MTKYVVKNFKLDKKGLGMVLGDLEHVIMEVLWDRGEGTVNEVLADIRRERKAAITTVFTVLERLFQKGLLRKSKGESVYVFEPVYTKEEFTQKVSKEVLKSVIDLCSGSAISSFVDIVAKENPEELDRLTSLISAKKQEIEKGTV